MTNAPSQPVLAQEAVEVARLTTGRVLAVILTALPLGRHTSLLWARRTLGLAVLAIAQWAALVFFMHLTKGRQHQHAGLAFGVLIVFWSRGFAVDHGRSARS